jgi:hypothetical protein
MNYGKIMRTYLYRDKFKHKNLWNVALYFYAYIFCNSILAIETSEVRFNYLNSEIIGYSENVTFSEMMRTSLLLLAARLEVLDRYLELLEDHKYLSLKLNWSRVIRFNRDFSQDQKLMNFMRSTYENALLKSNYNTQEYSCQDIDQIIEIIIDSLFKYTYEEKQIYKDILNFFHLYKGPYNEREIFIMKYILKERFYPSKLSAFDLAQKYKLEKDALIFMIMLY